MRKRVVSRTISMVCGEAYVIVDDTVNHWEFHAPEVICKDLDLLRRYLGIANGWIGTIDTHYTYTAKAVMDEQDFMLAATIEGVKGGADNE